MAAALPVYLGAAALSLGATLLYSRFFAGGAQNLVSWQFHWGFLSQDKSPAGMFDYLMTLLGLAWPALIVLPFLMQGRIRKTLSFALWLPLQGRVDWAQPASASGSGLG